MASTGAAPPTLPQGPSGDWAEARRRSLKRAIERSVPESASVAQIVAHLESVDGLDPNRKDWIKMLVDSGSVELTPATGARFYADEIAETRLLKRIRDGLSAMEALLAGSPAAEKQTIARSAFENGAGRDSTEDIVLRAMLESVLSGLKAVCTERKKLERMRDALTALDTLFAAMGRARRRRLARNAFQGIEDSDAAAALQILLKNILTGVRAGIAKWGEVIPASDRKLQMQAKVAAIAAVFHKHGMPIGVGSGSPFILTCGAFGISRSTAARYLPEILPYIDQYVQDVFGAP